MLVSHETPISILDHSRNYNDYDYALVHLFDTHPKYYNFFKSSLNLGREVMLDNSIFELGTAFDSEKFADYVRELKPTYYIIPDVLEECDATITSYYHFTQDYQMLPGLKVGVVQGKTYDELVKCYKFMSECADYIAISFDYSYYQIVGKSTSMDPIQAKLERMCNGRQKFIDMLIADGIWDWQKPHHLLGNSLPIEMIHYKHITNIRSVDTSNPIIAAIKGIRYKRRLGIFEKPSVKLADLIDIEIDNETKELINYNTTLYKEICNM